MCERERESRKCFTCDMEELGLKQKRRMERLENTSERTTETLLSVLFPRRGLGLCALFICMAEWPTQSLRARPANKQDRGNK